MAKRGRKKKVWAEDFKTQQKILLEKHARQEPLTQEEICFLVGKDGKMPSCREDMVTKMTICKWEIAAMKHLKEALLKYFPGFTESQLKDTMLEMLSHWTWAKEAGSIEAKAGILW